MAKPTIWIIVSIILIALGVIYWLWADNAFGDGTISQSKWKGAILLSVLAIIVGVIIWIVTDMHLIKSIEGPRLQYRERW
jgi:uncharacterized membrane protein YidH (DUF202 family)